MSSGEPSPPRGRPTPAGVIEVVGVVASPRGGGTTATAVAAMLAGADGAGARTRLIDLSKADHDDAIRALGLADAVVLGSPTYRASHTALLAEFLEHVERGMKHERTAPLQGTAAAIVMTGAAHEHFLATETLRTKLSAFFAAQVLSPSLFLSSDSFGPTKELLEGPRDTAVLQGRALVELATALRNGPAIRTLRPLV